MRADSGPRRRGGREGEDQPHPRQAPHTNKEMAEEEGRKGRRKAGRVKEKEGREQKSQAVWGNPVQSKPNQNFKPYLRCLTSGEPDLGKGKERKRERKEEKKERKEERNKENTSHQNQPERREGKLLLPQFKNPF